MLRSCAVCGGIHQEDQMCKRKYKKDSRAYHFRNSNKMKTNRCLRYITKSKIYNWREMSANLKVQIKKWKNSI